MSPHEIKHPPRHGVAVVRVIAMMGLCACLGYAMLYSATTDAQAANNSLLASQADALAESGVNLGMYYLRYPDEAPTDFLALLTVDTYDVSNITFGPGVNGYVNLRVMRKPDWNFEITSTGVAQVGPLRIVQTIKATAHCTTKFSPRFAVSIQGDATISGTATKMQISAPFADAIGPMQVKGKLEYSGTPMISGTEPYAESTTTYPFPLKPERLQSAAPTDWNQLGFNGPTYTYNGQPCTAEPLVSPLNSDPPDTNLDSNNPLRIYYCATDLILFETAPAAQTKITINGTLVVNGRLILAENAAGGITTKTLSIKSPVPHAPALVVEKDLAFLWSDRTVDLEGVVWIGEGITGTGSIATNARSKFKLTGAYLTPHWQAELPLQPFAGSIIIQFPQKQDALQWSRLDVPDFSQESNQVPKTITLRSFR
jgi:hypothetical protein